MDGWSIGHATGRMRETYTMSREGAAPEQGQCCVAPVSAQRRSEEMAQLSEYGSWSGEMEEGVWCQAGTDADVRSMAPAQHKYVMARLVTMGDNIFYMAREWGRWHASLSDIGRRI